MRRPDKVSRFNPRANIRLTSSSSSTRMPMTDLDKLQGAWNVATLEMDGGPVSAPADARIVIQGSRFQSLGMGAEYAGTVEVDGRKKPKTIDMIFTTGPEKGNRSLGIYEL